MVVPRTVQFILLTIENNLLYFISSIVIRAIFASKVLKGYLVNFTMYKY